MTLLRRLQGITYVVLEDPGEIFDFVNRDIRKEWENDRSSVGEDPGADDWLLHLHNMDWRLEIVLLNQISMDQKITDYKGPEYNFATSLSKRVENLRSFVEQGNGVIWPLVVREDGLRLMDGYCRLTTLRQMNVTEGYCYVGKNAPSRS